MCLMSSTIPAKCQTSSWHRYCVSYINYWRHGATRTNAGQIIRGVYSVIPTIPVNTRGRLVDCQPPEYWLEYQRGAVNTLIRPQNGRHIVSDILKCLYLNENILWYYNFSKACFRKSNRTLFIIASGSGLYRTGNRALLEHNMNMSSYQYMDPHVKNKTVSRPSYL